MDFYQLNDRHTKACLVLLGSLAMVLVNLYSLFDVPSAKHFEAKEDYSLLPARVAHQSYAKRGHYRKSYYVVYDTGTYKVLQKQKSKSSAYDIYHAEVRKTFTLHTSTKDSDTYRLVESGETIKSTLQEERNPFLLYLAIYGLMLGLSIRDVIINRP